jgi:hypothetical protein
LPPLVTTKLLLQLRNLCFFPLFFLINTAALIELIACNCDSREKNEPTNGASKLFMLLRNAHCTAAPLFAELHCAPLHSLEGKKKAQQSKNSN